jgi:hypothetical protein
MVALTISFFIFLNKKNMTWKKFWNTQEAVGKVGSTLDAGVTIISSAIIFLIALFVIIEALSINDKTVKWLMIGIAVIFILVCIANIVFKVFVRKYAHKNKYAARAAGTYYEAEMLSWLTGSN